MAVYKVGAILLDYVDSILFGPVIPEICYFKHDVGISLIIIFVGSPAVYNIGEAILLLS